MSTEKRLIDYEQAKRATYEEIFWSESEQAVVRHFLAKLPKVDAVEVVRCENCKYFGTDGCAMDRYSFDVTEEGFCSYGERKGE